MSEPLSWALSYAGKKTLDWLISHGLKSNLPARLRAELADWAANLPADIRINPEALFPDVVDRSSIDNPAFAALQARLEKDLIPTAAEWAAASRARRDAVVAKLSKSVRHPFFNAPDQMLEPLFQALGERLERVCRQDEALFKGEVLAMLHLVLHRVSPKPASAPAPPRDELLHRIMALLGARQKLVESLAALAALQQQPFDQSDPRKALSLLRFPETMKDSALKVLDFTQTIRQYDKFDIMESTWVDSMADSVARFLDVMVRELKAHGTDLS